ncbi:zinc transporter [Devosia geojensis]|uniref:High-affinity zinc uptake system protein ZnuA n=1 Tax=Devosia geojensis TaxID=443610 RepID=A0A0F5FUG0_9HYPH|nr:zinc ABC transporter substrate-binding protein ZnuA [Devosia geojensis]KKB12468.1 zinc transporter [Devosia geojensis]
MRRSLPLAVLAAAMLTSVAQAAPDVVASIKPVHSLVAAVMEGVGEPRLLVTGNASPHTYSLRPSDAGALQNADIVFWTGHGMELFLADALDTLSIGATVVELAHTPGVALLPVREGGAFEAHSHGDEGHDHEHDHEHDHDHDHDHAHDHEHEGGDMHFWLDPQNAKAMVTVITETLSEADPENAQAYAANAERELAELDALTAEIERAVAPVAQNPFVVFHDAYQYFENRFGLTVAGSVTVSPEVMPGAQRITELKARVGELGAACVFAEPQFEPTIISAITEGTGARTGVLDPEGGLLTEGPDLYPELLRGLAASLVECLGE